MKTTNTIKGKNKEYLNILKKHKSQVKWWEDNWKKVAEEHGYTLSTPPEPVQEEDICECHCEIPYKHGEHLLTSCSHCSPTKEQEVPEQWNKKNTIPKKDEKMEEQELPRIKRNLPSEEEFIHDAQKAKESFGEQETTEEELCGCEAEEQGIEHTIKAHLPEGYVAPTTDWEGRFEIDLMKTKGLQFNISSYGVKLVKSFIQTLLTEKHLESYKKGYRDAQVIDDLKFSQQKQDLIQGYADKMECLIGYLEYFLKARSNLQNQSDEIQGVVNEAKEFINDLKEKSK